MTDLINRAKDFNGEPGEYSKVMPAIQDRLSKLGGGLGIIYFKECDARRFLTAAQELKEKGKNDSSNDMTFKAGKVQEENRELKKEHSELLNQKTRLIKLEEGIGKIRSVDAEISSLKLYKDQLIDEFNGMDKTGNDQVQV